MNLSLKSLSNDHAGTPAYSTDNHIEYIIEVISSLHLPYLKKT